MSELLNEIDANEVTDRLNLAVVYTVESLEPIPNKDRIELVHLKDCGYTTICEKGHAVGDKVVFIKYDTVLPKVDIFDFMASFKYRVKQKSFTERDENDEIVKKMYSQGIVLPVKLVFEYLNSLNATQYSQYDDIEVEGYDLTEDLGVKKYIPPTQGGGGSTFGQMRSKGDFPTHVVGKTDEINLASKVRALDELRGKPFYITLKIEGSSLTTFWDKEETDLNVCSRNNQIGEHETNKFWIAAEKYNLRTKLVDSDFAIQAELYGEKIQKNKLGIEGVDMAVFNVSVQGTRERMGYSGMIHFLADLGLPMVPLVMTGESFDMTFDELQELADKQVYANGEVAEGIVIRPMEPFYSKVLKELWSVKVINRDYKL